MSTPEHSAPAAPSEGAVGISPSPDDVVSSGDGGASLVFWILITLALVVMAPCMILPAWREYQSAELSERARAAEALVIAQHAQRLERRLDAIHNDPVVIARLARRELRCTLPGEVRLAVRGTDEPADHHDGDFTTASFDYPAVVGESAGARGYAELFRERVPTPPALDLQPVEPPVVVARLTSHLPRLDYDALFCTSPTRETLLGMSVVLVAAAFIIFWPRCPRG